ncbi:hypothetical protein HRbin04_00090 [archaeon HR04]|nr:hypothetical protein HRbin04_00090 [archaeon HR04]
MLLSCLLYECGVAYGSCQLPLMLMIIVFSNRRIMLITIVFHFLMLSFFMLFPLPIFSLYSIFVALSFFFPPSSPSSSMPTYDTFLYGRWYSKDTVCNLNNQLYLVILEYIISSPSSLPSLLSLLSPLE